MEPTLERLQVLVEIHITAADGELDAVAEQPGIAAGARRRGSERRSRKRLEIDEAEALVALEHLRQHRAHTVGRGETPLLLRDLGIQP